MKMLTLSIVIPVYNEENYLKLCLNSIAAQSIMPTEVIVVDNNSVDSTKSIARSYPFVKVMQEKRQGQTYAQATGFNEAKGDIFGRIDADTILPANWVKDIINSFAQDKNVVALTGDGIPYDSPLKRTSSTVFRFYHAGVSRFVSGHVMLWGANTAFRGSSWNKIKAKMSYRVDIWEDYEMSFLMARIGQVKHLKGITIGCSFRAAHRPLLPQLAYQFRAVRTFRLYNNVIKTLFFFILWYTMVLLFVPMAIDRFIWKLKNH